MKLKPLLLIGLLGLSAFAFFGAAPASASTPSVVYYVASNSSSSATSCSVTLPSAIYGDEVFVTIEYCYNTFGSLHDGASTDLVQKASENVYSGGSASTAVYIGIL